MIDFQSPPGRQAKGLRHSSRGHRPRNTMAPEPSCPSRLSPNSYIRLCASVPLLATFHVVAKIRVYRCSSVVKFPVLASKIRKPAQGYANLRKPAQAPPQGRGGCLECRFPTQRQARCTYYRLFAPSCSYLRLFPGKKRLFIFMALAALAAFAFGARARINPNQPLNDKIPAPYRPLPAKK